MKGKKTSVDEAMILNNQTYIDYYNRLKLLALSIFEWEGLEEICGVGSSDFLEEVLFETGRACFIKDETLGYMTLYANPSDKLNVYRMPTKVMATSIGYNKSYDLSDIVYIKNNKTELSTAFTINLFAKRLYELERTIDVNIKAQKTPVLIEGTEEQRLTLQNLYMQYDGNMPFIFGKRKQSLGECLKSISTKADFLADKLTIQKHEVINECLTFLGIDNANTDKRERLITDEVESNDELIYFYLNCFYSTRKRACDEINKKFFNGEEKIKIKINKNIAEVLGKNPEDFIEEGEDE